LSSFFSYLSLALQLFRSTQWWERAANIFNFSGSERAAGDWKILTARREGTNSILFATTARSQMICD
jgi:hypothetical protein